MTLTWLEVSDPDSDLGRGLECHNSDLAVWTPCLSGPVQCGGRLFPDSAQCGGHVHLELTCVDGCLVYRDSGLNSISVLCILALTCLKLLSRARQS